MEIDGSLNRSLVDTERGVGEFTTAMEFVLRHRGLDKAHLFAMSRGGTVAGAFAARGHRAWDFPNSLVHGPIPF